MIGSQPPSRVGGRGIGGGGGGEGENERWDAMLMGKMRVRERDGTVKNVEDQARGMRLAHLLD